MNIYKNAIRNVYGTIDCLVLVDGEWLPATQLPENDYKVAQSLEAGDWVDVKPCPQAEKDAHQHAQAITNAVNSIQEILDGEARKRGYDNINSIAKYMGYDNIFRAECEAIGAWCAACWAKCYELQAGGVMPADLIAEMPVLAI